MAHRLSEQLSLRADLRYHWFDRTWDVGGLTGDSDPDDFAKLEDVALATIGLSYRFSGSETSEPARAAPKPVDWSGAYAGVSTGYGRAYLDSVFDTGEIGAPGDVDDSVTGGQFDPRGALAGVHVGYNHMIDQLVVGVEAGWSWTDIDDRRFDPDGEIGGTDNAQFDVQSLGSLRARVGYASGRTLFYGSGGLAVLDAEYTVEDPEGGLVDRGALDIWELGYVVGAGLEHAVSDRLSIKLDGLYYGFQARKDAQGLIPDSDPGDFFDLSAIGAVEIGLRYHFSPL